MTLLFNLLWFVFGGGFIAWLSWLLTGVLFVLTVVGIPFAYAAFRIAGFAAFPFGRVLLDASLLGEEKVLGTGLMNLLWMVLAGVWLALAHIVMGVTCCLTLIGIPFGLAHFKLAGVCFAPLGKRPVPSELAQSIQRQAAQAYAHAQLRQA